MQTTFIGREEVLGYLQDLLDTLKESATGVPKIWCSIGDSGDSLALELLKLDPDSTSHVQLIRVDYERLTRSITLEAQDQFADCKAQDVLLLDSAIHSGNTMGEMAKKIVEAGAKSLLTYTLAMKRGASFIPSLWALMIGDHDRAYFLLKKIVNSSLGKLGECEFTLNLRKLAESDIDRPVVTSSVSLLDKINWADRFYAMVNGEGVWTYVLEACGNIVGYITFELQDHKGKLLIHEVAVDKTTRGRGFGKALMRWAETCRTDKADVVEVHLWAIEDQLKFYSDRGYKRPTEERSMRMDTKKYFFMYKPVLSHLKLAHG